jgi:crotonobetainyl-CoA:carnitine CoA-transferase CaiB-like acyl-CoA transferase
VLALEESLEDAQIRARGMVVREGDVLQLAPPLKMSDYEFSVERPAPAPGEHSEQILREAGYADAAIGKLRAAGVI